jgi:hypothetical protein
MATKKINATINFNGTKNSYEIGFSEAPKKDTPAWTVKESIKNDYLFRFYGGTLNLWCKSATEVTTEDLETIKAMLKDAGFKVTATIGGKATTNKKNTAKTKKAMAKAIASQTITKPAPKTEEPKTEPVKAEAPKTEEKKTAPKKQTPKKTASKKTEPVKEDEELKIAKQIVEQNEKLIAWLTARR